MKTKVELLWHELSDQLRREPIGKGEFRLLRIAPECEHHIAAGIDASGKVLLAVEVDSRPPDVDVETRALEYFRHQRSRGKWLMVLRLVGDALEQVFGRLCQDLADEASLVVSQAALIQLFQQRLMLWKKLFQSGNNGCLEKYQVKGLVAELIALQTLFGENPDSMAAAVFAWVGPLKRDQDFIFPDGAIEVKAIAPSADYVGISSEDQLDTSMPLELWVYFLQDASPADDGSICIIDLVAALECQLAEAGSEALSRFRSLLLEVGYIEQECYEECCFNLIGNSRYEVTEHFPRLINQDLPQGVSKVSYAITVMAMESFRLGKES